MDASYLLSVLDLYLLKEKNGKLIIEVDNNENLIKVNFSYSFDHTNRTFVKISREDFFNTLGQIISKVQGNSATLGEEKTIVNNKSVSTINFSEGRKLAFIGFKDSEMKLIKSYMSDFEDDDLVLTVDDTKPVESYNEIYETAKKANPKVSFSFGFSSYLTLFLTTIWFLDIFMIALWIFKAFIK